jgi:ferric-dicitrate binding protein FerR (iron transport regulator)
MKPTARETKEFRDLLGLIRDGQIRPEQEERLDQLLGLYPSLQQDYIEYMLLCEALHSYQSLAAEDYSTWPRESFASDPIGWIWEEAFWRVMADYEKTAPAVPVERPAAQRELHPPRKPDTTERRKVKRTPLVVALSLFLGFLVFVVSVSYFQCPAKEAVAILTDAMGARWSDAADTMKAGGEFFNTDSMRSLLSGFINIQFYCGSRILIEGPAEFKLPDTNKLVLRNGRIYVKVPLQATGFIVDTPNARIVDLGTEFGIEVDKAGNSDVQMFKGMATLIPGRKRKTGEGRLLLTDQALQVNQAGEVRDIRLEQKSFVRKISSRMGLAWRGEPLNLADILGGGNGFGKVVWPMAIDPASGFVGYGEIYNRGGKRVGKRGYFPVPEFPCVDGVFVPDKDQGPLIVSSDGLIFNECPDTTFNCWTYITNQPQLAVREVLRFSARFNDRIFGTPETPGIYMHTNAGMTFDLDVIRATLSDFVLKTFTTTCGIVEGEDLANRAGFLVLVDGEKRGQFHAVSDSMGRYGDIIVPLKEGDHFLTLITVDDGDDIDHDWTLFGLPYLTIEEKS